ncbi:MAG: LamG domain-containing protein, partial [Nanoarchaeota archaeon]
AHNPSLSPTSALSVSAFISFDALGENTNLVWKESFHYILNQQNSGIYFNVWNSSDAASTAYFSESDLTNGFNHIVGTFENGISKIYLNGVLKNTSSINIGVAKNSLGNLFIGKRADNLPTSNIYFDGSIDDAMIFNKSLSSDEIIAIYNKQK